MANDLPIDSIVLGSKDHYLNNTLWISKRDFCVSLLRVGLLFFIQTSHVVEYFAVIIPKKKCFASKGLKWEIIQAMSPVDDEHHQLALTAWKTSTLIGLQGFPRLMGMFVSQDHWASASTGWAPVNNLSPLNAYR